MSAQDAHDFTELPMTFDGWTDLKAMFKDSSYYNDSRIVYVSITEDDSTAQYYEPGDEIVGNDPFLLLETPNAYQTMTAAYEQLRDGYPDIMLLKRGDDCKKRHWWFMGYYNKYEHNNR